MSAPKQLEPLRARPTRKDAALEGADLAVRTLKDVVALAPLPIVADAAGLVLSIIDTLKEIRDNKEAFKHLVDDAVRLVYTASETCRRLRDEGHELSHDLVKDLGSLVGTLTDIRNYAFAKVKRGLGKRILYKNQDLETIRRYREELKQALDTFTLQSTISIRHNVAEISRSQDRILRTLESQDPKRTSQRPARQRPSSTPLPVSNVPYSPSTLTPPQSADYSRPYSSPPTSLDILIPHTDPFLRSLNVPMVNEALFNQSPSYASPTSYHSPTQPQSPPGVHVYGHPSYQINSGNVISNVITNSNNNYSHNNVYYGVPARSPQGAGSWAAAENWT